MQRCQEPPAILLRPVALQAWSLSPPGCKLQVDYVEEVKTLLVRDLEYEAVVDLVDLKEQTTATDLQTVSTLRLRTCCRQTSAGSCWRWKGQLQAKVFDA